MKLSVMTYAALFAAPLVAQTQPPGPPLWEVGVAAGAVTMPAYPAASARTSRALVLPFVIYRGEILRVEQNSIRARLLRSENYEVDLGFSASLPASSSDMAVRSGMPDLGTLVEFGPRVKLSLARPTPGSRLRLELPVRAVLELNHGVRTQGLSFEPELLYEIDNFWSGWRLTASGSLVWGDQRLNTYFYGVAPSLATAARPSYEAQAGLIAARLGMSMAKTLTPEVRLYGFVRYERYDNSANRASPLFLQSEGASAGIGLTWTLGQSSRRAADSMSLQ